MVTKALDKQEGIIHHIARYRLTLPRFLVRTSVCGEASLKAVEKLLESMVEEGTLNAAPLRPEIENGERYYYLATRTAAKLGYDLQWARPLAREQRAEYYAAASFCCESEIFREVMTKKEFSERFAPIWFPGQPVRYYLEPTESDHVRLAFIKVDSNGDGHWGRLIDSSLRFLRKRTDTRHASSQHKEKVERFSALVQRGLFQFTVLTSLPEKKRAIELEMERRLASNQPTVPMKVEVIPGLFELLFPPSVAA